MECRNAAAGALSQAIVRIAAQHEHRTAEPFHQAAGDNAEHSTVPILRIVDQGALGFPHRHTLAEVADLVLHTPPLGVLVMQLSRQFAGARGIGGEEEFHHVFGGVHAARGIHARRDLKRHLPRAGRRSAVEASHFEQCAQSQVAHRAQSA